MATAADKRPRGRKVTVRGKMKPWGGSYGLVIPKDAREVFGATQELAVDIEVDAERIVITKAKRNLDARGLRARRPIKTLVKTGQTITAGDAFDGPRVAGELL